MTRPHIIPDGLLDDAPTYHAGETAPPGTYWELDGLREVRLLDEDVLPASLDGRVAIYVPKPAMWRGASAPGG